MARFNRRRKRGFRPRKRFGKKGRSKYTKMSYGGIRL